MYGSGTNRTGRVFLRNGRISTHQFGPDALQVGLLLCELGLRRLQLLHLQRQPSLTGPGLKPAQPLGGHGFILITI